MISRVRDSPHERFPRAAISGKGRNAVFAKEFQSVFNSNFRDGNESVNDLGSVNSVTDF